MWTLKHDGERLWIVNPQGTYIAEVNKNLSDPDVWGRTVVRLINEKIKQQKETQ